MYTLHLDIELVSEFSSGVSGKWHWLLHTIKWKNPNNLIYHIIKEDYCTTRNDAIRAGCKALEKLLKNTAVTDRSVGTTRRIKNELS